MTIIGGMCVHFMFGATTFDQLWYVEERGYDRALIAQTTGWFGVVGGVTGNLFGGIGSDYWQRIFRCGKNRSEFRRQSVTLPVRYTVHGLPRDNLPGSG